jgi:hypothetical protein
VPGQPGDALVWIQIALIRRPLGSGKRNVRADGALRPGVSTGVVGTPRAWSSVTQRERGRLVGDCQGDVLQGAWYELQRVRHAAGNSEHLRVGDLEEVQAQPGASRREHRVSPVHRVGRRLEDNPETQHVAVELDRGIEVRCGQRDVVDALPYADGLGGGGFLCRHRCPGERQITGRASCGNATSVVESASTARPTAYMETSWGRGASESTTPAPSERGQGRLRWPK